MHLIRFLLGTLLGELKAHPQLDLRGLLRGRRGREGKGGDRKGRGKEKRLCSLKKFLRICLMHPFFREAMLPSFVDNFVKLLTISTYQFLSV